MSKKFGKMRRKPMDALDAYVREYRHRIANANDARFRAPQEKANGYADRKINLLARQLIRRLADLQGFITDATSKGWSPGPKLQSDAFAWVACAFYGMLGDITKAENNQIRLTAHKLRFAYDAGVPSQYVSGYLYQIGGSKEVERQRALERGIVATMPRAKKRTGRKMSLAARQKRGRGAGIGKRGL